MFISYLFINYLFFLYINFLIYLFNSFWLDKYFKLKIKIEDNSKCLKHALRRFVENTHISLELHFTLPVVNYNKLPLLKSNFTSAPYGIYAVCTGFVMGITDYCIQIIQIYYACVLYKFCKILAGGQFDQCSMRTTIGRKRG